MVSTEYYYEKAYDRLPDALQDDETFMPFFSQLFDERLRGDDWHATHNALQDYLLEKYELVLDDFFDWREYGEWYDSIHG